MFRKRDTSTQMCSERATPIRPRLKRDCDLIVRGQPSARLPPSPATTAARLQCLQAPPPRNTAGRGRGQRRRCAAGRGAGTEAGGSCPAREPRPPPPPASDPSCAGSSSASETASSGAGTARRKRPFVREGQKMRGCNSVSGSLSYGDWIPQRERQLWRADLRLHLPAELSPISKLHPPLVPPPKISS